MDIKILQMPNCIEKIKLHLSCNNMFITSKLALDPRTTTTIESASFQRTP